MYEQKRIPLNLWKCLHLPGGEGDVLVGRLCVYLFDVRAHLYRLRRVAKSQSSILLASLAGIERNLGFYELLESGHGNAQFVMARRKLRHRIAAARIGDRPTKFVCSL